MQYFSFKFGKELNAFGNYNICRKCLNKVIGTLLLIFDKGWKKLKLFFSMLLNLLSIYQPWTFSFKLILFCRTCRTRINTGMKLVSCAPRVGIPWWTNSLDPKLIGFTAVAATTNNLPHVAMAATKSSELVSRVFLKKT